MHRLLAALALTVALPACGQRSSAPAAVASTGAKVARVVFVDKEKACDCTRKRVDAGWATLSQALAGRDLPVERVYSDTQAAAVEPLRQLKPFMALPAAYLVAPDGSLVALLQGEWTTEQLAAVLDAPDEAAP